MNTDVNTIGLIVNPIAGMGGRVGLKGTDTGEILSEAVERGAKPTSRSHLLDFVDSMFRFGPEAKGVKFLICRGEMGGTLLKERLLASGCNDVHEVYGIDEGMTSGQDTMEAVKEMVGRDVSLIVFAGGDGTARDVLKGLSETQTDGPEGEAQEGPELRKEGLPHILGVPTGVKMHSSIFALSPTVAGEVAAAFLMGKTTSSEREVMDIDEADYRSGVLTAKLYGYARVPVLQGMIQAAKSTDVANDSAEKEGLAEEMAYEIEKDPDTVYFLGAGTTVFAIKNRLEMEGTLLGVDAVLDGVVIGLDTWERHILGILDRRRGKIVVAPVGRQGFLLGRGNQQFSPEVIREVGPENIIVVATRTKLQELDHLVIYTGDEELDAGFPEYMKVIVGLDRYRMVKVRIA